MLSSVYNAVQQASICEYKSYWHMNFSLINGYILSFEVALVSSPILKKK